MPRFVVPILFLPLRTSRCASSSRIELSRHRRNALLRKVAGNRLDRQLVFGKAEIHGEAPAKSVSPPFYLQRWAAREIRTIRRGGMPYGRPVAAAKIGWDAATRHGHPRPDSLARRRRALDALRSGA